MRKLCPNLEREDGLDTVLEVPIPEEMFVSVGSSSRGGNVSGRGCTGMMSWVRRPQQHRRRYHSTDDDFDRAAKLQLMLGVVGAPLVPFSIRNRDSTFVGRSIKDEPIEASMAKYIVQQYIAAAGGEKALNSISSMYAVGKVEMMDAAERSNVSSKHKKGGGEMGGFVLWQKKPDLWCLELVVSGCKLAAGSDGKVAWRQTPGQQSHASTGPPRPLRRILQGLDPRSIANLFSGAVCDGEKSVNGYDCFVLRLDAESASLQARSTKSMEMMRHTVWGYFSQRTGLLVQLEDSHLVRIRGAEDKESVYWETTMSTLIEDYRVTDSINISHKGTTSVSLSRFGETIEGNMRTSMEEAWTVEEVGFDVQGLSMECFLPPGDLKEEKEGCKVAASNGHQPIRVVQVGIARHGSSKVVAVNMEDSDSTEEEDEKNLT